MKNKMKIFLMKLFLFYRNTFKFKPIVLGKVFNGIGIGLISNVLFVVTTNQKTEKIYLIAKIGLNRTTMQELDRTQKRSLTGQ